MKKQPEIINEKISNKENKRPRKNICYARMADFNYIKWLIFQVIGCLLSI